MDKILRMLRAQKRHLSFHTPGHKRPGKDITELSYSDNLSSPTGVLKEAEEDIAEILGADQSFLLTDGSTCGVFSMLLCLKLQKRERVAVPVFSHPSVFHACKALGLEIEKISQRTRFGLPLPPEEEEIARALNCADALLLTSPDYYGFFPPLKETKRLCLSEGKPFLIDGAHGAHLHFCPEYAGNFADLWVDGAHKSLPALTQGAVVSGKGDWAKTLYTSVRYFRTTSPSYPILASVEHAIKYPRNLKIEALANKMKELGICNEDWTKLLVPFGSECEKALCALEKKGIYPEFSDGNYLLFYLSPCTRPRDLKRLRREIKKLPRGKVEENAPCGHIPMY